MKRLPLLLLFPVLALLAACGEKPQTNAAGVKHDAAPWSGLAADHQGAAVAAPGWQAGDRNAWEQELRTRAQNGQNEYSRIN